MQDAKVITTDIVEKVNLDGNSSAIYHQLDVTNKDDFIEVLNKVKDEVGKIDILINNAGISLHHSDLTEYPYDIIKKEFDVNVFGVINGLSCGPAYMNDGGAIINTSSQASVTNIPGQGPYCATKSSINSLTRCAAIELADRNINVNAVCPTYVNSPLSGFDEHPEYNRLAETMIPLGNVLEVENLYGIYQFLASDDCKYITGQSIVIDGGWTAGLSNQLISFLFK